eukprot:8749979-Lingulodinium_polyedra.AAC.1
MARGSTRWGQGKVAMGFSFWRTSAVGRVSPAMFGICPFGVLGIGLWYPNTREERPPYFCYESRDEVV